MEKFSEEFQKKVDVWSKIYELMEKESEDVPLRFSGPLTIMMGTDKIDEEKVAKILGEQPLGVISLTEAGGEEEMNSECTMSIKVHKALREKPENNGAYWCACADVMDGNILEKCFWREVTFFNGMWCVDSGTLVLAWMALPPSQNPKDFL